MLLIDPRLEHISRRIGKLDKRVLRCFELKTTAGPRRRAELDNEIQALRDERAELMSCVESIKSDRTWEGLFLELGRGPIGGSAETSRRRVAARGGVWGFRHPL